MQVLYVEVSCGVIQKTKQKKAILYKDFSLLFLRLIICFKDI